MVQLEDDYHDPGPNNPMAMVAYNMAPSPATPWSTFLKFQSIPYAWPLKLLVCNAFSFSFYFQVCNNNLCIDGPQELTLNSIFSQISVIHAYYGPQMCLF